MQKVRPIHKNDPRVGPIKNDKLQRSVATIQRPTRRRNKRRLHLGDWTVSINRNDEDGKRKEINFRTIIPSIGTIQATFYSGTE